MRGLVFCSFLLVLASCKSSGEKALPKGLVKDSIIPQNEMISILADVHILESALQFESSRNKNISTMHDFYYRKLFSDYKISRRKFSLNLNYYEMDPENLRKMYGEVVKKLENREKLVNPPK